MLWLDFETRARCDLKTRGVYNYAMDPSTEVLCMSYAFGDEDVTTWTPSEPFPARVRQHTGLIYAHNAAFERLIFWHVLKIPFALEQFYCTATQARANCAPGSLEDVGRFAGAGMKKDHRGEQLIRLLSVPQADGQFREDAGLMAEMVRYCEQDVRAMRAISQAMRPLTPQELADYHVNERINDRGVKVDVALCHAAVGYAETELEDIQDIVAEATGGELRTVRSPKTLRYVLQRVSPETAALMVNGKGKHSIDKSVRANLLAAAVPHEIQPEAYKVVECLDAIWASSVAKFKRLAQLADDADERVRGAFVFAGGSATGRASSYGAQVHNFTRKCAQAPDEVRQAMVRGHKIVPTYGPRTTDVLKGMLRPALIPAKGKQFVAADWSAIEARVNPWLSGRGDDKLDLFRTGQDVYKVNAAATFRVPVSEVDKDQRQIGKVQELACLSEDTLVLTACGEKRIQDVLPGDLVWDGVNWVPTDGPVYKGERNVIEYDGLCATPDHLVWVEGSSNPVKFEWAATNGLRLARAWARVETAAPVNSAASHRRQTALRKSEIARLCDVWRKRSEVFFSYCFSRVCLGVGEPWVAATGDGVGPHRQCAGLRAGQFALVYQSAKPTAYVQNRQYGSITPVQTALSKSSVRGQYDEKSTVDGADVRANRRAVGKTKLQTKRRVWDLLNCGPLHRFTAQGRLVHNCGFAGGVGAFAAMGRAYGLVLPEPEAKRMVQGWRIANPWAVPFWQDLETAYTRALRNKGYEFSAGRVTYLFDGVHLWYALPSGRVLCYPYAKFEDDNITYAKASWKPAATAKEWPRARLWRGLACENITQATAHDLLRHSLRVLDQEGWDVVLHVHDEIVVETDRPEEAVEAMERVMCSTPEWAKGLPLNIEAAVMGRYGK